MSIDNLPMLEHLRMAFQRHRIQMGNRLAAVEQGRSTVDTTVIQRYCERFEKLEEEVKAEIAEAVEDHEMWPWLSRVKGIGPGLAGCLLAHIDIEKANSQSALWKYAGQAVNDQGTAMRPTKGEKLPYNAELKKICYLISTSFLRAGSPYRREYDCSKGEYQRLRPDWTPGHQDMAARRKMVKLFLSHLWVVWRYERNLSIRPPYAIQVLRHDGHKYPWEYVDFPYDDDFRRRQECQEST